MTFQELMTQELANAGYSDEQVTAALTKIYTHDKLGPKLNALVKTATEDYNAQVGRVKQYQDWYPKAQAEYDRMATEYSKVMEELQQLRNGNGNGNGIQFDASKYVSKDDLMAMQTDMARRVAGVIKDTSDISGEHMARFREKVDLDAVDRIANEKNIPLKMAYEKYVEPRMKEEETKSREEWKKQQREEIERDIRSRYKLPVDQPAAEQSHLFTKSRVEDAPKDMDVELLDAWRSTPAKT